MNATGTITVIASPTTANAGPDQLICTTSTTLAANAPSVFARGFSLVPHTAGTGAKVAISLAFSDYLNTGIGYIKLGRVLLRSGRFREAIPETERGYAIVRDAQGHVVRAATATAPGAPLHVTLHEGALHVRVETVRDSAP